MQGNPLLAYPVDLHRSFRSPDSYLATPRLDETNRRCDVEVALRPVCPGTVRDGAFLRQVDPLRVPSLMKEHALAERKAA